MKRILNFYVLIKNKMQFNHQFCFLVAQAYRTKVTQETCTFFFQRSYLFYKEINVESKKRKENGITN